MRHFNLAISCFIANFAKLKRRLRYKIHDVLLIGLGPAKRFNSTIFLECIVDHESFNAVCLNKDVLWTALVNLADREGTRIPQRDNVENRYAIISQHFSKHGCSMLVE